MMVAVTAMFIIISVFSGLEDLNRDIPEPSNVIGIQYEKNQALMLIEAVMPLVRDAVDNQHVKKNVTLPKWLEQIAKDKGINFSSALQDSLKEKLFPHG